MPQKNDSKKKVKKSEVVLGAWTITSKKEEKGSDVFARLGETTGEWTSRFLSAYKKSMETGTSPLPCKMTLTFGLKVAFKGNVMQFIRIDAGGDVKLEMSWDNLSGQTTSH